MKRTIIFFTFLLLIPITDPLIFADTNPNNPPPNDKITVNFYETNIKNLFRLLSRISGKNFAIDDDVTGKVTLHIEKPVSWKKVLNLVLKMKKLGMSAHSGIIRIAKLETLKTEKEIEAQQKALESLITKYINVNYVDAERDIKPHIIVTEKRGKISVDKRNNQVIITDTADMIVQAAETVRRIDKVTQQVTIEARIVEATNSFSRKIGAAFSSSGNVIDPSTNNILGNAGTSYTLAATNPPTSALGSIGIAFQRVSGIPFSVINAQIEASESKGNLSIISSPYIMTVENKTAVIKQGVRYPLTKQDDGGNTITTFEDINLELKVTPHITRDDRISMKISISNNEIGAVINGQTSFTTKEAETELLINNGDTVVIGGIKKNYKDISESGFPLLKDIPLIGWLFGSKSKTESKSELIIFIMPKIVRLERRG